MAFPQQRLRRLRAQEPLRRMLRETRLAADDFVYPLFLKEGAGGKTEISSMPGVYHHSLDSLLKELEEVSALSIPAILLFGLPGSKDETGSEAYAPRGIVQRGIKAIKASFPDLMIITDICLCAYTTHGHCGIIENGRW